MVETTCPHEAWEPCACHTARTVDLRPEGWSKRVEVGEDQRVGPIAILLWDDGRVALEHDCPGVWRDPDDGNQRMLIAPLWSGQVVSRSPLTLSPSLLCLGSAGPCGLHGFVTEGVWRGC